MWYGWQKSIEDDEEKSTPRSELGQRIVAPFVVSLQDELMTRTGLGVDRGFVPKSAGARRRRHTRQRADFMI